MKRDNQIETTVILSDYNHASIIKKSKELTEGKATRLEKLEAIFYFVRDSIKFGFPSTWDELKASEVLELGFSLLQYKGKSLPRALQSIRYTSENPLCPY